MFKIEKNVPPPDEGRIAYAKYPMGTMEVGDSFLIPANDAGFSNRGGGSRVHRVQSALNYWRKKGRRFTVRTMPDRSMRVWRTA